MANTFELAMLYAMRMVNDARIRANAGELGALAADIVAVRDELAHEHECKDVTLDMASRRLTRRIGAGNLRAYLDSLTA